jgi:cation diffusion facilitator family transporter
MTVTRRSLALNVVLAVVKTSVGQAAHSQALVADGLHSLADLAGDIAALLGLSIAAKPGDDDHPYGHHKFASLATLFVAALVLSFCTLLIIKSARSLLAPAPAMPGWPALAVAVVSLFAKEGFYHYASRQARRLKSRVLAAGALDHRADAFASLLATAAILAALLGGPAWAFLDKVAGLALGGYLALNGANLMLQSCADLLDTAPRREIINDLREHVLAVPGTVAYHNFRARRVGDLYEVDLHLQVDEHLSVEAGHDIAGRVKRAILAKHPEVVEVLVHLEPASALRDTGVHDRRAGSAGAGG